jgi:hypothetical protein
MAVRERTLEEELARFVTKWRGYSGTEIADTQGFIRHLAECYDVWEYAPGTVFEQHPVETEEAVQPSFFGEGSKRPKGSRSQQQRMDFYLRGIVIWEQKGPREDLARHFDQILLYWAKRQTRYLVLCNFREFWIWDTEEKGWQDRPPQARFTLEELPANARALEFLRGGEAYFAKASERVTREAAQYIGGVLRELIAASDNPLASRERYTKFVLECVFAMYAEDAGIIQGKLFSQTMNRAQASGDLSPVYNLFDDLGRAADEDRSYAVPYINGPLFDRNHPKFPMARTLLATLHTAAENYDWQAVRPEVFGSIFEHSLLAQERMPAGAHFTSEADIMKVVGPTVVRPWQERIATCKFRKDADKLIEQMCNYHILDPACGSGNFLYVAYREMKGLEVALRKKHYELWTHKEQKRFSEKYPAPRPGPWFSIRQLHGIDKLHEAVQLTRVVLWIGEHYVNRELTLGETTLPLASLEGNIIEADALLASAGGLPPRGEGDPRALWPRPDGELAIVGNPPFMGSKKLRMALGDHYLDQLQAAYPDNRMGDLVTYWYPQTLETLRSGERAGFVSTNSIAQNESREASLEKVVAAGGSLVDCWKSYPWQGEAAVHVSIINWIMQQPYTGAKYLNGQQVDLITVTLSDLVDVSPAQRLEPNRGLSYQGVIPGNEGFILEHEEAAKLIESDPYSEEVIRPFLIGADLNRNPDQSPSRYVIDFGFMELEEARSYKAAFRYAQKHIYPVRAAALDRKEERLREKWWQMVRPRGELRSLLRSQNTYLATANVSPQLSFVMMESCVVPDHQLIAFGLDSYYHFGILQSAIHEAWAWARGSTLKGDLRYTNTTIFETFPFPLVPVEPKQQPVAAARRRGGSGGAGGPAREQHGGYGGPPHQQDGGHGGPPHHKTGDKSVAATGTGAMVYDPRAVPTHPAGLAVAQAAEALYAARQDACKLLNLGLTKLYNLIKGKPGADGKDPLDSLLVTRREIILDLRRRHEQLNAAVCTCYGWEPDTWRNTNEVLKRLLELNREVAEN